MPEETAEKVEGLTLEALAVGLDKLYEQQMSLFVNQQALTDQFSELLDEVMKMKKGESNIISLSRAPVPKIHKI